MIDLFKVKREGEEERFQPFAKLHNRQLLWHGSRFVFFFFFSLIFRTTNFAGIISQGLRIAPPEAPVTGYMFGKGVYFADACSKSANYCRTSPSNPIGLYFTLKRFNPYLNRYFILGRILMIYQI